VRLSDVVLKLKTAKRDEIICARRPWVPDTDCMLVAATEQLGVPSDVKSAGFDYFLEVHVALEVLEAIGKHKGKEVELLIHYATFDAFPDWLYE
jgi:hypothetical protein